MLYLIQVVLPCMVILERLTCIMYYATLPQKMRLNFEKND